MWSFVCTTQGHASQILRHRPCQEDGRRLLSFPETLMRDGLSSGGGVRAWLLGRGLCLGSSGLSLPEGSRIGDLELPHRPLRDKQGICSSTYMQNIPTALPPAGLQGVERLSPPTMNGLDPLSSPKPLVQYRLITILTPKCSSAHDFPQSYSLPPTHTLQLLFLF